MQRTVNNRTVFSIDGERINVIRSKRKTMSIEIKTSGITVRAPLRISNSEIERFLKEKESWIRRHMEKVQERRSKIETQPPFTTQEIRELAERAAKMIPERVRYYAPLIGVDYGRITIRCQRTRWGSCSSKGNLNFNCLLVLMPEQVLDSVVVHELCHRKHMNHSKQFYEEIEKVFPEYKKWHGWLKTNGSVLLGRLP